TITEFSLPFGEGCGVSCIDCHEGNEYERRGTCFEWAFTSMI
ncbi:hypothetical protein NPIL_224531, partial [Nephila pilipes]